MMQKQVPGLQKDSSFLHIKQITSKHLPISLQEKNRVGKKGQGGECSKLLQLVSSLAISCTQIPMLSLSNRTKQTVLMVEDMVATKQLEMALRISWAAVCFGKPFLPLPMEGKATDLSFFSSARARQFFTVLSSISSHLSEPQPGLLQWMTYLAGRPKPAVNTAEGWTDKRMKSSQ